MSSDTSWTIRHFPQANPSGPGQDSVPALLRRIADTIDSMGPIEVQDLVVGSETTELGQWWSGTVYFHPPPNPPTDVLGAVAPDYVGNCAENEDGKSRSRGAR